MEETRAGRSKTQNDSVLVPMWPYGDQRGYGENPGRWPWVIYKDGHEVAGHRITFQTTRTFYAVTTHRYSDHGMDKNR
jgi:hypothetical protein